MERDRVRLVVCVDLDPMPGAMHTPKSAMELVFAILNDRIPHYNPAVEVIEEKPYTPTHNFNEIVISNRVEAEVVLTRLNDRITNRGKVYVGDFYRMVDLSPVYADDRWGWTDLREAKVVENDAGWSLDLPKPERL